MKNTILIASAALLVLVLCASLGGNAYQYYQSTQAQDQIKFLQNDLLNSQARISKASSDLSAAQSDLDTANAKISTLTDKVEQVQDQYNDLNQLHSTTQDELDQAQATLNEVYCTTAIPIIDVKYTSTNKALLDPITGAIEDKYGLSSVDSSYDVFWTNSKDAMFTIKLSDNTTSKVTVSWSWISSNHVRAIYDINGGCYFYFDQIQ